jgi:hypothetical protein
MSFIKYDWILLVNVHIPYLFSLSPLGSLRSSLFVLFVTLEDSLWSCISFLPAVGCGCGLASIDPVGKDCQVAFEKLIWPQFCPHFETVIIFILIKYSFIYFNFHAFPLFRRLIIFFCLFIFYILEELFWRHLES